MNTVNLTALAETRAKMDPGEYRTDEYDEDGYGALHVMSQSGLVAIMPDDERSDDNAAGLVAEHNAMPVLLEVVAAALAIHGKMLTDDEHNERARKLYAVLAKVTA
jgi:hypothetical protein